LLSSDYNISVKSPSDKRIGMDSLPEEILRMIIECVLDLPTLGYLLQTNKYLNSFLSNEDINNTTNKYNGLMNNNNVWFRLLQKRFQINSNASVCDYHHSIRPKTYSASNWKMAYKNVSSYKNIRIPKCRYTSKKKVIFAKSCHAKNSNAVITNGSAMWIMMNHTEDCNTRGLVLNNRNNNERYVQLQVCVQNIKSITGRSLHYNFDESYLMLLSNKMKVNVLCTDEYKPYVVYHSKCNNVNNNSSKKVKYNDDSSWPSMFHSSIIDESRPMTGSTLVLEPLEFAIVLVSIPCTSDIVYETDFLCHVDSFHVPFFMKEQIPCQKLSDHSTLYASFLAEIPKKYEQQDQVSLRDPYPLLWHSVTKKGVINAKFMNEKDVWNHYTELPGGCLSRVNRSFGL